MNDVVARIVIVGGGTAGWLAACAIAARADPQAAHPISVTLIESPDLPTVGVGEGTWPTIRRTLQRIGLSEAEVLLACDASFKQGSRFVGWRDGGPEDAYFHPFVPPPDIAPADLVRAWRDRDGPGDFAHTMSAQPDMCDRDLAPRQRAMPDYAGAVNYAYHLDAAKLAAMLMRHATTRLGVRHVRDHVDRVVSAGDGDIAAVGTRSSGAISGDLFIDCTGHAAMLIGGHHGVGLVDRGDVLFNDRALAVQVPVAPDSRIASQTDATAHAAGWIWDIGLPTRRGVGCVYSSRHASDDQASATLAAYLGRTAPDVDQRALSIRRLEFRSAHRARFWVGNCLAIGLSAGFLEPLEASAIVLIELSLDALLDDFPRTRRAMAAKARRFDALFLYRWDRIVDFLKLHYVLSRRDERYWRDHRDPATIPAGLADLLEAWRDRPPVRADVPQLDEVFPAASYQYVLYGMGFPMPLPGPMRAGDPRVAATALDQVRARARSLAATLPTNRAYLAALAGSSAPQLDRVS